VINKNPSAQYCVIPAKAGIQRFYSTCHWALSLLRKETFSDWMPAFAGMTG
jgi:hypothetical protein